MAKLSTVVVDSMILRKDEAYKAGMYRDLCAPLINICKKHQSYLDRSTIDHGVFVYNATPKCRRDIRYAYGKDYIVSRQGVSIQLRGL